MTTYTKIAARGVIIVFCASILASLMAYLVRLVLARNLTVEEFGLFYAVIAFLGLIGIFKSLGLDRALVRFIPEFIEKKDNGRIRDSITFVIGVQLITNTIVIGIIYLLSSFLGATFFKSPQADVVLKIMAIAFFIDSFVNVLKLCFQAFQKTLIFAFIDLSRMVLLLVFIWIGIRLNAGIVGPMVAYTLVPLILLGLFGFIFIRSVFREFSLKSIFNFSVHKKNSPLYRKISSYALFLMVAGASNLIIGYTDTLTLTYFKGLTDVALYNISLPTARIMLYFPFAIGFVLFPLTAELWVKKQKKILKEGMEVLYKYVMIAILPLALCLWSFSNEVIIVLFGNHYVLATSSLQILSLGMIFAAVHTSTANFFLGIGESKIYGTLTLIAAMANLVGNIILIPIWGIEGAALSTAFSYVLMATMGLWRMRKFIRVDYSSMCVEWFKIIIAGIVFTAAMIALKNILMLDELIEVVLIPSIGVGFYAVMLLFLRVVKIEEVKSIVKRVAK